MIEFDGLPTCGELNMSNIWEISGSGTSNITVLPGKTQNEFILINGNDYPITYQCCFGGVGSITTSVEGVIGANSVKHLKTSANAWYLNGMVKNQVFSTRLPINKAAEFFNTTTWLDQDYRSKVCPSIIDSSYTYSQWISLLQDTKFPILRVNGYKIGKLNNISAALVGKELTGNGIMIKSYVPLFIGWVQNGSEGTFVIAGIDSSGGTTYWKQKE